jgi:hypothetical protein
MNVRGNKFSLKTSCYGLNTHTFKCHVDIINNMKSVKFMFLLTLFIGLLVSLCVEAKFTQNIIHNRYPHRYLQFASPLSHKLHMHDLIYITLFKAHHVLKDIYFRMLSYIEYKNHFVLFTKSHCRLF